MYNLSIKTQETSDGVKKALLAGANALEKEGISVEITEEHRGPVTVFGCFTPDDGGDLWWSQMARIIAAFIVNNFEARLVLEIIERNYRHLKHWEKRKIKEKTQNYLTDETVGDWRDHIVIKLQEYFQESNILTIEGFIRFRLQDYLQDLKKTVEDAADDYLLEKEYQEFLRLLKYFVDVQEPRTGIIQVVLQERGTFKLFDGEGQPISTYALGGALDELAEQEMDPDDLLISTLVSLAPAEILLHCHFENSLVELLKKVFTGKVRICPGCRYCKKD